jgi:hypothetical protein
MAWPTAHWPSDRLLGRDDGQEDMAEAERHDDAVEDCGEYGIGHRRSRADGKRGADTRDPPPAGHSRGRNEVLEALRLRAMRGSELGFTEVDIADQLGVPQAAARRWWMAYTAGGPGSLAGERAGRPVGSGRMRSDGQARHIQDLIENHSPEELSIPTPQRSRWAARDLILRECGRTG